MECFVSCFLQDRDLTRKLRKDRCLHGTVRDTTTEACIPAIGEL